MMKAQEKGSCDLQRFSKRMSLQKVSGYRFQVSALFAEACSLMPVAFPQLHSFCKRLSTKEPSVPRSPYRTDPQPFLRMCSTTGLRRQLSRPTPCRRTPLATTGSLRFFVRSGREGEMSVRLTH